MDLAMQHYEIPDHVEQNKTELILFPYQREKNPRDKYRCKNIKRMKPVDNKKR